MHPADSVSTFQAALTAAGMTLADLTPAAALAQMAVFYLDVRADKCILDEAGDSLVFQWGVNEQEPEPTFQLEFARHFIEPGNEDEDGMSEMSLILHYAPTPALRALETGVHECSLPTDLMEFEKTILASPAYQAVAALKPQETTLDWFLL